MSIVTPAPPVETPRRASVVSLFVGVAAMGTGLVGASTAGTLIASDTAAAGWSGLPNAAGVLGTALGALGGGMLIQLRGARFALLLMYGVAVVGAGLGFAGAMTSSLLLLLAGMTLIGVGSGAAQLARYAAAELYPDARKGYGLSVIVWAGTIGALAGPALLAPAAAVAERLELTRLAGPFLAAGVLIAGAAAVSVLLPRMEVTPAGTGPRVSLSGMLPILRSRVVVRPLTAMVAAHVSMVAVMTMTPLQMQHHGHDLVALGWVLSAHMVGMFALAPLSGRIVDRWGARVAIYAGVGTLVLSATTVILAPTAHTTGLPLGLFLLGYGWNLVFVGGSSMLSRDLPADERPRVQGAVDACVWGASAFASVGAGPLYALGGLVLVAVIAGSIALVPLTVLARR